MIISGLSSRELTSGLPTTVNGDVGDLVNNQEIGKIPCATAEQFTSNGCYHLGDEASL